MKYCSHCGKELMDEAVVCVHCGCAVDNGVSKKVTANSEKGNTASNANAAIALAIFLPLLGLICGIIGVSKCTNPEVKGKYTLSIVLSIVAWIAWAVIFSAML